VGRSRAHPGEGASAEPPMNRCRETAATAGGARRTVEQPTKFALGALGFTILPCLPMTDLHARRVGRHWMRGRGRGKATTSNSRATRAARAAAGLGKLALVV
jgi:hypothetical protein